VHFLGRQTFAARFRLCLPGLALAMFAAWVATDPDPDPDARRGDPGYELAF
jgi:hypothetical protein